MKSDWKSAALLALLAGTLAAAPARAQHNHDQPAAAAAETKPAAPSAHDHGSTGAKSGGMHGMHKMGGKMERQGGDCGASAGRKPDDAVMLGMIATLEALTQMMKAMHAQSQR